MSLLPVPWPWHRVRDAVDIVLVAWLFYRVLLALKGSRAQQMAGGLAAIVALHFASKSLGFVLLTHLLSGVLASMVLIVVVVFQGDIRRALMRMGDGAWFRLRAHQQERQTLDEIVAASSELARHRIGALIAIERQASLDEYAVGKGVLLDFRKYQ